jgi:hypothetical protein
MKVIVGTHWCNNVKEATVAMTLDNITATMILDTTVAFVIPLAAL